MQVPEVPVTLNRDIVFHKEEPLVRSVKNAAQHLAKELANLSQHKLGDYLIYASAQ